MVANQDDILDLIDSQKTAISQLGIKRVGLFGSFARGEENAKSDIDLLIEFDKNQKNFRNYMNFVELAENLLGKKVEVVTPESLSPYIAPYIKNDIKYIKTT